MRNRKMALVKLRKFSQITLPVEVRRKLNLADGDYLEAEVVEEGVLLKPVAVIEKDEAWQQVFEAMERVHDRAPRRKKTTKEEEEIARMVKAFRKQHA
jgi:AbrB family looped-hinge helix DNA binding protein